MNKQDKKRKKSAEDNGEELFITGYVLNEATGKLEPYKRKIKSGV